jgi:tetratricopeptide (TPR) repeat protein
MAERLFALLRRIYPHEGGLSALIPDLLGERLVARAVAQDDELLDIALARHRDPQGVKRALTVLTRLAHRDPTRQSLLTRAFDRHLSDHLRQSLEVGSETGEPMPATIYETVRGKPRGAARQIIVPILQAIPKDTTNLRGLAAAIAQINIELIDEKATNKHGVKITVQVLASFKEAAERYEAVCDWTRAAEARRRVFEQTRASCKPGNHNDLRRISAAHSSLATALSRIGDFQQALKCGIEPESGFHRLAERQFDADQVSWAASLMNLANRLEKLGRFDEAIEKAQAAEGMWRRLAQRNSDPYRAKWARSLEVLANSLGRLARFREAIENEQAAEAIWRELADVEQAGRAPTRRLSRRLGWIARQPRQSSQQYRALQRGY